MTSARTGTRPAARRTTSARRSPARTAAARKPAPRPAAVRKPPARRPGLRRRLASWGWLTAVLAVVALVAVTASAEDAERPPVTLATAECTVPETGVELSAEQVANARTIAQVALDRGLPERAVVIALATAMQESTLHNLPYGDRDSLGLFQQRPSQGWGTPEQVQDPVYAAGQFYDRLVRVPGWQTGELTVVADTVQRSAFPRAYQRWDGFAQSLTTALGTDEFTRDCG
ncbi:hypothetical protein SAMN05660690_1847 [Geodermatophilus telluris]|uniref:Uncharacterized protein n=1 Tax=Geodermatophilus telluris TaxID=1190417 RepID=A0A1G6MH78_9ACTN|nr:hypothetical protein [Geodermatophilus telluris]SDC54634.1 hypothetical protein SAMN05660690_1847 [Geodermatophilus telluris]